MISAIKVARGYNVDKPRNLAKFVKDEYNLPG